MTTLLHVVTPHPAADERRDVIAAAKEGDVEAFECLYRQHIDRLYGLCFRLVGGDPSHATQLAQDVFVRAWERLSSFRGEASFATWLHRIAVNVWLSHRRSTQRREHRESVLESTKPTYEAPFDGVDGGLDLEQAIAGLPPQARTVFILAAIEGYRHEEIAEMMQVSVGTSKAQLHRARTLLQKVLR